MPWRIYLVWMRRARMIPEPLGCSPWRKKEAEFMSEPKIKPYIANYFIGHDGDCGSDTEVTADEDGIRVDDVSVFIPWEWLDEARRAFPPPDFVGRIVIDLTASGFAVPPEPTAPGPDTSRAPSP